MSKMDNLRAMREAKYARAQERAGAAPTPTAKRPASPAAKPPAVTAPKADAALCGHRNMSGRTCTREPGHAAKSHRYS